MRRTSELLPPTQAGAKVGNIFVVEKARHNRSMIATVIGLHQSTISRELRSNRGYWHTQAHSLVLFRRQSNPPPLIDAERGWSQKYLFDRNGAQSRSVGG